MVYNRFVWDLSCLDFSSKILTDTERPKVVGEICQSDKNYTLYTSLEEKNAYAVVPNINREIKTVFNSWPLFFISHAWADIEFWWWECSLWAFCVMSAQQDCVTGSYCCGTDSTLCFVVAGFFHGWWKLTSRYPVRLTLIANGRVPSIGYGGTIHLPLLL